MTRAIRSAGYKLVKVKAACYVACELLHTSQRWVNIITYLLALWSRVLLEKLTGFQLVKKFPAFYGTRRFITVVASARHLSLT